MFREIGKRIRWKSFYSIVLFLTDVDNAAGLNLYFFLLLWNLLYVGGINYRAFLICRKYCFLRERESWFGLENFGNWFSSFNYLKAGERWSFLRKLDSKRHNVSGKIWLIILKAHLSIRGCNNLKSEEWEWQVKCFQVCEIWQN